jgi:hypothetical protein
MCYKSGRAVHYLWCGDNNTGLALKYYSDRSAYTGSKESFMDYVLREAARFGFLKLYLCTDHVDF